MTIHITQGEYLARAVKLGVDELAHVAYDQVPEGVLEEAARRGITLIPTFSVFRNYGAPVSVCVQNLGEFLEARGRVVLGNDFAGGPGDFESGVPLYEMTMMSRAGMSSMDIILASTRDAALACGADEYLGTIEKGKLADIVVVKGDPLQDLGVLKSPLLVMKEGTVIVGGVR